MADEYEGPAEEGDKLIVFNEHNFSEKDHIKREIYLGLSQLCGVRPPWGILTGVRPVKLAGDLADEIGEEAAVKKLRDFYLLSEKKASLLAGIYRYQQELCGKPPQDGFGLYVGIPFCPTRCLYCSFTSYQQGPGEIARYLKALKKEIAYAGRAAREAGIRPETVYIGGGTPTTLDAGQLAGLIDEIKAAFDLSALREFTVEAGRPDTLSADKLKVLADRGARRISINPQTMKDDTLSLIGRSHRAEDVRRAFALAAESGSFVINADLIAGLPEESPRDFAASLAEIIALGPQNVTVHTLAVKKASRLIEEAPGYHYDRASAVEQMLDTAAAMLGEAGYRPYYLYRQKHMAGALENVGYCRDGELGVYNVRIMEEKQSILALGAGGISKKYFPRQNRLERVPNVSNYTVYIDRIDEMIERKRKNFFEEVRESAD